MLNLGNIAMSNFRRLLWETVRLEKHYSIRCLKSSNDI